MNQSHLPRTRNTPSKHSPTHSPHISHTSLDVLNLLRYPHLKRPKSYWVEEYARLTEEQLMRDPGHTVHTGHTGHTGHTSKQLVGSQGFATLLAACLRKLGGSDGLTQGQRQCLVEGGVWGPAGSCPCRPGEGQGVLGGEPGAWGEAWRHAALKELKAFSRHTLS